MSTEQQVSNSIPSQSNINQLRERAQKDPVFNAVMHRFASRKRARSQVTTTTLRQTMLKEGFDHPREKYEAALEFLAKLGFGQLYKNSRGRVVALRNIKVTLQSIGKAALGQNEKVAGFKAANTYTNLPSVKPPSVKPPGMRATLTVMIDEKVVEFPLLRNISSEELGFLLADLYAGANNSPKGRA